MTQNSPEMDRFVTGDLTNLLFKSKSGFGSDLIARNIQVNYFWIIDILRRMSTLARFVFAERKGPRVNELQWLSRGLRWRWLVSFRVCGSSQYHPGWLGFSWTALQKSTWHWLVCWGAYRDSSCWWSQWANVHMSEGLNKPFTDDSKRKTLTKSNFLKKFQALQFSRLKNGDRYFFTHNTNTGFNANQLNEIRTRRLSDVICQNSQQPDAPLNAFLVSSAKYVSFLQLNYLTYRAIMMYSNWTIYSNPSVSCSDPSRNRLNLNLF